MNNTRPSIPPYKALDLICKICETEYNSGKRKININKIWNIAYMGICSYDADTSTSSFHNEVSSTTTL